MKHKNDPWWKRLTNQHPTTHRHALFLLLGCVVVASLMAFVVNGIAKRVGIDENVVRCTDRGYVWLSGQGISEHGCYDLKKVSI